MSNPLHTMPKVDAHFFVALHPVKWDRSAGMQTSSPYSRRSFIKTSAAAALAFGGVQRFLQAAPSPVFEVPLLTDPNGILDLPAGFKYTVLSRAGEKMTDGLVVPGSFDGMGAFEGENGTTVLIRNHELSPSQANAGPFGKNYALLREDHRDQLFDPGYGRPSAGGTTTLVLETKTNALQSQFLSLAGTVRNCAGGITPWGSWITCEEATDKVGETCEKDHGFAFEVPSAARTPVAPVPLAAMGRFRREAVAVDPASGFVYQTEDTADGLIYRFVPDQKEKLSAGGKLQALALVDKPKADTRNWEKPEFVPGRKYAVKWIPLDEVESPRDDLRRRGFEAGAACFARGEGMIYSDKAIYFICTNGGPALKGQIWKFTPAATSNGAEAGGDLELLIEASEGSIVENGDNIVVSPWGDLFVCEDKVSSDESRTANHVVAVTPSGQLYRFARNAFNKAEFAGACFSPDGNTMFLNIFNPGLTLAVWGDWRSLRPA